MRVLLSAYVCEPGLGSEPEVGWVVLQCAAADHQVTLLTQSRCAPRLPEALAAAGLPAVRIVAIEGLPGLGRWHGRWGLGHLDYAIWQLKAWRRARALRGEIDVAHHATFGTDWMPSGLMLLHDVPLVWGPVGGTSAFAWRLARFMTGPDLATEMLREVLTRTIRRLSAALVRRRRPLVVARNADVQRRFSQLGALTVVEPLVGLPEAAATDPLSVDSAPTSGRRALFISRLTSWKGAYLAIHTLAELSSEWTLEMYGEGPGRQRIEALASRLGVADRLRMMGRRPREEVFEALMTADVLLFPSMRDSAPYPVVEAVRVGCPVVCLDAAGPPQLIQGTGGIAVRPDRHAPARLAEAMLRVDRGEPDDRWSLSRLRPRVDAWYREAAERGGVRAHGIQGEPSGASARR